MTTTLEQMSLFPDEEPEIQMEFITVHGESLTGGFYATIEEAEMDAIEFADELFDLSERDECVELVGGKFLISGAEDFEFTDAIYAPQIYIDAYRKWVYVRSKGSSGMWEPRAKLSGEY